MRQPLTLCERVFIENYIDLRNGTKAALIAYRIQGKDKNKIASTMASQVLRRPRIREFLVGMFPDEELILMLRQALFAEKEVNGALVQEDWGVRMKALELCLKLKGYLNTGRGKYESEYNPERELKVTFAYNGKASDKDHMGVPKP